MSVKYSKGNTTKMQKGTTKHCCYGVCRSDTRREKFKKSDAFFINFPKPCLKYRQGLIKKESVKSHVLSCVACAKSRLWVKACGRADNGFKSMNRVTKDTYICSLHFEGGRGPTDENPNPINFLKKTAPPKIEKMRRSLAAKYSRKEDTIMEHNEFVSEIPKHENSNVEKSSVDFNDTIVSDEAIAMDVSYENYNAELITPVMQSMFNNSENFSEDTYTNISTIEIVENASHTESIKNPIDTAKQAEPHGNDKLENSGTNIFVSSSNEIDNNSSRRFCDQSCQTAKLKMKTRGTQTNFGFNSEMENFSKSIEKNEKQSYFYTGLAFGQILSLHEFLSPACENLKYSGDSEKKGGKKNKKVQLTSLQQLILVLIRLRMGFLTMDLAYRFNVSTGYVSKIVSTWIMFMYNEFTLHLKPFMFPSRRVIAQTLPKVFKDLKNIRTLIDCTEFFCESPTNFEHQGNLYSSYKAHTTFKVLIGCTPNGCISFVSDVYEGSISDRDIVIQSNFVDLLEPGDVVLADRGFVIHDIVEAKQAFLNIPPFLNGRASFTAKEELETKRIAKQRIYVEHAIGRLKKFRLLTKILPLSMRGIISEIVFVCGCLVNFQTPIVFDT